MKIFELTAICANTKCNKLIRIYSSHKPKNPTDAIVKGMLCYACQKIEDNYQMESYF